MKKWAFGFSRKPKNKKVGFWDFPESQKIKKWAFGFSRKPKNEKMGFWIFPKDFLGRFLGFFDGETNGF